jgi:hypothetical protein
MTQNEINTAAANMIKYGGSFMSNLGKALQVADKENQDKIVLNWKTDVERYANW